MTLAQHIKAARLAAGLSQEKVAEAMDVSRQAVAKWESGRSAPSTANLIRLAEILGTSVDALTGTESEPIKVSVDRDVYAAALVEAKKQLASERSAQLKHNILRMGISLFCWLVLFLAGRMFCTTAEEPMTVIGWLFDTSPQRATYLFGWLTGHGYYLWCSVISVLPALFSKVRFSHATFSGFTLGFVMGELFGRYPAGVPYGHGHYGWAIWGGVFLTSVAAGIIWEIRTRKTK